MAAVRIPRRATKLALIVLLLSGCRGGPPEGAKSALASDGRARGGKARVSESADNDADGIRDRADVAAATQSASSPVGRNEMAAPAPAPPPGEKRPEPPKEQHRADGNEAPHETSMLIYTARVTMAVYQVDQGLSAVEKIARDAGGYLAVRKDREITVRIPRARFDITLIQIDKIGDVLHRDVQAQDVTDEFVDAEIRVKNARAMQARLKILLDKASVKEALEIEKEMRRVTEEIELLEGKLKLLKDKIAYSTITVAFEPRGSTIQSTRIRLPFPWLNQLGLPTLLQLSEER